MSEDKAREIIAENVAKEVVENIGEDLAGALVEYANLVKDLAADLSESRVVIHKAAPFPKGIAYTRSNIIHRRRKEGK